MLQLHYHIIGVILKIKLQDWRLCRVLMSAGSSRFFVLSTAFSINSEVFFNPKIYNRGFATPLPVVIDKCIQSAPIDTRRSLYKNIVLSRGSMMFKEFHRRLQREAQPVEFNVVSHPIQKHAVWFGGSVLASTQEFFVAWRTQAEYEEYGASVCRTNPVFKGMY
ncbi:unnamed protein product [Lactuca virosa]|uniref:Uncharacterized protein n=1 Tax=Lactuca virosa TaxID=75947 RepID=A0AAU9LDM7_9ASTR|nr:unnamed protein product [Lactuca virosa]